MGNPFNIFDQWAVLVCNRRRPPCFRLVDFVEQIVRWRETDLSLWHLILTIDVLVLPGVSTDIDI